MTDIQNKPTNTFREELKWIVFVLLFIGSIIFNYFTTVKQVGLNTYRIEQIETARKEAWAKYDSNCEKQIESLEKINKDIVKIKVKLGIDN